MQQNIKVDVIYYLSPSDFEMEFNLCGCCHMRLLKENAKDRKSLVKALAKAVSRSKVMILCGPLFDENGLINIVSTAIGKSTEVIDNAAYGINYDGSISVIEGSIPLVTPDGLFGGCIIESGPQAIVVLSENKSIRKTIMNNLIHQYVYELSCLPENALAHNEAKLQPVPPPLEEQSETQEQEIAEEIKQDESKVEYEDISSVSNQPEAVEEVQVEESCEAQETETLEEINEVTEQSDTPIDLQEEEQLKSEEKGEAPHEIEMYIDPQRVSPQKTADYAKNYVPSEKDSLFVSEEDCEYDYDIDDEDEDFKPLPKSNLLIILTLVILSLIIVVLLYLMVYIPYSKGIDYAAYIEQIFGPASNI